MATVYRVHGLRHGRAVAELERGIDQRDVLLPENFFDPLFEPLHSQPEFAGVRRRMGVGP